MSIRTLVIASVLLTAACAHRGPDLPVCDGSARRPANPHGSILDGTAVPDPAPPSTAPDAPAGGCA